MQRTHGIAQGTAGGPGAVHFGIALWPYDLLLRFGYDLPENEHLWAGKWFDDRFEAAALDLRGTAAKLLRALRRMDAAVTNLEAAGKGGGSVRSLDALREAVQEAPLALDLVLHYLQRIRDGVAAALPCIYGQDGRVLRDARTSFVALAGAAELGRLDPALPSLLDGAPSLDAATHKPDLYVIAASGGYAAALPKAAARALRDSAVVTLEAGRRVDAALRLLCGWLDGLLSHLQHVVAARAEPGPDLLDRWAERDWSVLQALPARDPALEGHLPAI
jgi:hypothetical protein